MSSVKTSIKGQKELFKALDNLEKAIANKILRTELRAATKELAAAIKAVAPVGESGQLKRAVRVKAAKRKKGRIGFNATIGQKNFVGDTFYGGFAEFGTTSSGPGAAGPGQKGQHFMEGVFKEKGPQLAKDLPQKIWAGIQNQAKAG